MRKKKQFLLGLFLTGMLNVRSNTLKSLFSQASHPSRIRVGIVDETDESVDPPCVLDPCKTDRNDTLCHFSNQIDRIDIDSYLSVGSTFARHLQQRLYRGEYYALQVDSNTEFARDWDADLITQFENTNNEMAILSTYLSNRKDSNAQYHICNVIFEESGHGRILKHTIENQPIALPSINDSPSLHPFWSSTFSFSRGHFILTVPYDPHLPMLEKNDEEISMTLRAFTHGYDFYVPQRPVCFQHNNDDELAGEKEEMFGVPISLKHAFWENIDKPLLSSTREFSRTRFLKLSSMSKNVYLTGSNYVEAKRYGLGKVREVSQFFSTFGIHNEAKVTEKELCDFVTSGTMHNLFSLHLRHDNMGLDYNSINFRFNELIWTRHKE